MCKAEYWEICINMRKHQKYMRKHPKYMRNIKCTNGTPYYPGLQLQVIISPACSRRQLYSRILEAAVVIPPQPVPRLVTTPTISNVSPKHSPSTPLSHWQPQVRYQLWVRGPLGRNFLMRKPRSSKDHLRLRWVIPVLIVEIVLSSTSSSLCMFCFLVCLCISIY
jgi:hypothetical protein